jgi:hypothetical protein
VLVAPLKIVVELAGQMEVTLRFLQLHPLVGAKVPITERPMVIVVVLAVAVDREMMVFTELVGPVQAIKVTLVAMAVVIVGQRLVVAVVLDRWVLLVAQATAATVALDFLLPLLVQA